MASNPSSEGSDQTMIDPNKFQTRLKKLHSLWLSKKTELWGGCDAVCILYGSSNEDLLYSKNISMHLYLFGYELTESIILITKGDFYVMTNPKKCAMLQAAFANNDLGLQFHALHKTKDEGVNRENFHVLINAIRKNGGKKVGSVFKTSYAGDFVPSFINLVESSQLEKVEIGPALSAVLAVKDEEELVSVLGLFFFYLL